MSHDVDYRGLHYTCATGAQCGHINTLTNALGQVTTFNTYNVYGQPLTITDPNGVVTTLTYDARERITSSRVGTETTGYTYYPTGLTAHGDAARWQHDFQYTYDGAHRLTKITDSADNSHQRYTLDALGNRTAVRMPPIPPGTLHRTHTRVFNTLSELARDINAAGTSAVTTTLGYDSNGNLTSSRRTAFTQYGKDLRCAQSVKPNYRSQCRCHTVGV